MIIRLKLYFLLSILFCSINIYSVDAQNNKTTKSNKYIKEWKVVDAFLEQSKPKSALEVVEKIYASALSENNSPQIIKALFNIVSIKSQFEENAEINAINFLITENKKLNFPENCIINSFIAKNIYDYYQNNSWTINELTSCNDTSNDITLWDSKTFADKISNYYKLSISNKTKLSQIPIENYNDILISGENSRNLRPSLFDVLAYNAIDYFKYDNISFDKSFDEFIISNDFYKVSLNNVFYPEYQDSTNNKFIASKLFYTIESIHKNDKNPDAWIIAVNNRLGFAYENSYFENKDDLYKNALDSLSKIYPNNPNSAEPLFSIANIYFNKQNYLKAKELCENIINKFPKCYGVSQAINLLNSIKSKSISFETEDCVLPDSPSKLFVNYKNIDKLYFKIYQVSSNYYLYNNNYYDSKKNIEALKNKKLVKQWEQIMPVFENDYKNHSFEIALPSLQSGIYVVLCSPDANFKNENNIICYSSLLVSNLSYIIKQNIDRSYNIFTLNRKTGELVKDVNLTLISSNWDSANRKYVYSDIETLTSNNDGIINIPNSSNGRSFKFRLTKDGDTLYNSNNFYQNEYLFEENNEIIRTYLFTDRAIYRPGQIVYFKGITVKSKGDSNLIYPDFKSKVSLFDVNSQKIDEIELTTNEYGSFNGSFKIPISCLKGEMSIQSESYGSVSFNVEEYKRPKFEITFNDILDSYKINDSIKISGKAKSYSGVNINNAKVSYRIERKDIRPYYRWIPYDSENITITKGKTTTDIDGNFNVSFKAIPSAEFNDDMYSTYTVYVTITDLNGETILNEKSINVGNKLLIIKTDLPDKINIDNYFSFNINTSNLDNIPTPAKGNIKIYKIKEPSRLLRDRYWGMPDQFVLSEEEHLKLFPNDLYKDEKNIEKWEKDQMVYSSDFDNFSDTKISLTDINKFKQGQFLFEINCKDKNNNDITYTSYCKFYSEKNKNVAINDIDWFNVLKKSGEPGDIINVMIGSKAKDVNVLFEIVCRNKVESSRWINLSDEQKVIQIPIKENYRGNFFINSIYVYNNRIYKHSQEIEVPYSNKKLNFKLETFRNNLLPNENEEWKFKIIDNKDEFAKAEMVIAMYDASLDAFAPNNWYFNLYPEYEYFNNWENDDLFSINYNKSFTKGWNNFKYDNFNRTFDRFLFNSYYGRGFGRGFRGPSIVACMVADADAVSESKNEVVSKNNAMKYETPFIQADAVAKSEINENKAPQQKPKVDIRTNFNEMAFFIPSIYKDNEGNFIVKFKAPETLSKWKIKAFAHTKDLKYGFYNNELTTSKEVMVIPNLPRFLRIGDTIIISTKVINKLKTDINVKLNIIDPLTNKPLLTECLKSKAEQKISFINSESNIVNWQIVVPENYSALKFTIIAQNKNYSDGEEHILPVLSNRKLVTETLPISIVGIKNKTYTMSRLFETKSNSIKNERLTLEYTSAPIWYAIKALPYVIENKNECSEQLFNRYFSNNLASYIIKSNDKIKDIFNKWAELKNETAFASNLENNQELKSILLNETPWVQEAISETEQRKNIAQLFNSSKIEKDNKEIIEKLKNLQMPNGALPWFKGMYENYHITNLILTGFGSLNRIGIIDIKSDEKLLALTSNAVKYMDNRILEDYNDLKKNYNENEMRTFFSSEMYIEYLYMRSYFDFIDCNKETEEAIDYYRSSVTRNWAKYNNYYKGMIALFLDRTGAKKVPLEIISSLRETAIVNEEMGMYWKDNYENNFNNTSIEMQSLMIEAFNEIANDTKTVDNLKLWLLKQKQTNNWATNKATASACYALIMSGSKWINNSSNIKIKVGEEIFTNEKINLISEPGSGYFKYSWDKENINSNMGKIEIEKNDSSVNWGALYWQYFEDLDKIEKNKSGLSIEKIIYKEENTDKGVVLQPYKNNLEKGDIIVVKIIISTDRDMNYVHLKDMRASGLEPLDVISGYNYKGGLGFYQCTEDVSTNFFIEKLRKGKYVFEYKLYASQSGSFLNGISTIQCMYAPEFNANTSGEVIKIK